MKGLELARAFYEEYGAPMIREKFPQFEGLIATGLVGAGSECFGYDDETSRDHDFEPGFCMFLPGEDLIDSRAAFALERAYAKLPKEFMGFRRLDRPPAGGNRHGVIRTKDFYAERIGRSDAFDDPAQWFAIPEHYLAEAVNGAVFRDDLGQFSEIRKRLTHMPDDVRYKKLAGHLWMAAQSAPYNYRRCLKHKEENAAQWALYEFADHAVSCAFLICSVYRPFYKWAFRALRELPLKGLEEPISSLLTAGNDQIKENAVEEISARLSDAMRETGILKNSSDELSGHAFSVNDLIADPNIRNLSILYGV